MESGARDAAAVRAAVAVSAASKQGHEDGDQDSDGGVTESKSGGGRMDVEDGEDGQIESMHPPPSRTAFVREEPLVMYLYHPPMDSSMQTYQSI
jgi:hypothetical protein